MYGFGFDYCKNDYTVGKFLQKLTLKVRSAFEYDSGL